MAALGGLAIALSVIFGALVVVLLAELYYVFYWKKRREWNRTTRIINVDAAERAVPFDFDLSRETGLVGAYPGSAADPELVAKLCSGVIGTNSSLYMQGVLGGPRLLFTIKEETKEDMESEEASFLKNTLQSKFNESDDEKQEHPQQEQKQKQPSPAQQKQKQTPPAQQQWEYAYSLGVKRESSSPHYYYNSSRAMSPSLQPITSYSEWPDSIFYQSSSEYLLSPTSSPLPPHRQTRSRSSSLSSPSWHSSSSSPSGSSEPRFESPAAASRASRSSSAREQQGNLFSVSTNPIYDGDKSEKFYSPCRGSLSSRRTTPFGTPASSPSGLVGQWGTPPLTPPLTPIRAPPAAYSLPLLVRNLSDSTDSLPSSSSPSS